MTGSPIVVGFDGSPQSEQALAWGWDYAQLSGSVLRVICAWEVPPLGDTIAFGDPDVLRRVTDELVATATSRATAATSGGSLIEGRAIQGHPSSVLIHESERAQLLVLGARGRGGFADMLLGSVSGQCTHHAKCPVVIVRGEQRL
jgi:nucleotide-binding universal stress UspA family protein